MQDFGLNNSGSSINSCYKRDFICGFPIQVLTRKRLTELNFSRRFVRPHSNERLINFITC